jgi:signal transduction protein with GAF and PtsI domain
MEKKLKNIKVTTMPNGYSLDIEGQNGWLYFTPEKLLEGFMLHVGLEMTDQLNTETMDDFIVTAINWKENKECVKEIKRLTTALKQAQIRFNAMAEKYVAERRRYRLLFDCINGMINEISEKSPRKRLADMIKKHRKLPLLSVEKVKMEVECEEDGDDNDSERP